MKNVIITGGSSGLGLETAKKIAADPGYRLILACRNPEKGAAAAEAVTAVSGNPNAEVMALDISLLSSVRAFADDFVRRFGTADVLINNAGVSSQHGGVTPEGFELVFATNYLGHFLLTNLLLPHMTPTARIISVSSDMHDPPGGLEWRGMEHLVHPTEDDRKKYHYSKLCLLYLTYQLDEKLRAEGSGIAVNAFNPGFMAATGFSGGAATAERSLFVKTTMPERYGELAPSSDALARIAADPALDGVSGKYFDRSTSTKPSSPLSCDPAIRREVWNASLACCGLA